MVWNDTIVKIRLRSNEPCSNLTLFIIDYWPCMAMGNGRWWKKRNRKKCSPTNDKPEYKLPIHVFACQDLGLPMTIKLNEEWKKVTHTIFLELEWSINRSNITRLKPVFINVNTNNDISPFEFFPSSSFFFFHYKI